MYKNNILTYIIMTIREYKNQSSELVLDNTSENFDYYKITPTTTGINVNLTTRINSFTIENISPLYDITVNKFLKINSHGISKFKRNHLSNWEQEVIRKGESIQYVVYTNTAPYNDAQLSVDIDTDNYSVLWFKNTSTRTDHEFNLNTRPKFQNQIFTIHNAHNASNRTMRINFGQTAGIVKGALLNQSTNVSASTTAGGDAHTHALSDGGKFVSYSTISNTADRYVELLGSGTITLKGMRKPNLTADTSYYWTIDTNVVNTKQTAG